MHGSDIVEEFCTGRSRWYRRSLYEATVMQYEYWARCRDGSTGYYWK